MSPSIQSPPRSFRRKSVGHNSGDDSDAHPPGSPQRGGPRPSELPFKDKISETSNVLRNRMMKAINEEVSQYTNNISGADDPDFPISEVIQQMKTSATSLYGRCKDACEFAFDVPDNSILILLSFTVGVQKLLYEALRILKRSPADNDTIENMAKSAINSARRRKNSETEFTRADIDAFIEGACKSVGIVQNEKPQSIAPVTVEDRLSQSSRTAVDSRPSLSRQLMGKAPLQVNTSLSPRRDSPVRKSLSSPIKSPRLKEDINTKVLALVNLLRDIGIRRESAGSALKLTKTVMMGIEARLAEIRSLRANQQFSQYTQ